MDFVSDFQAYIEKHALWQPNDRLLLAFSGGLDSTLLSHLLVQVGADFGLAHVNYGLREEASADEAWCRSYAKEIGKPFYSIRFDTPALHATQKGSLQALARDLRYSWLQQVQQQEGYRYVVVAHHQDDALETLLMNLLRGTGIQGLQGIQAKRDAIRRPLLFASRKQLEQYAAEQKLTWREDSSNAQGYYTRNKIRHQLLPLLHELQPDLNQRLATTLENLQSVHYFYQRGLTQALQDLLMVEEETQGLPIPAIRSHPYPGTLLHEWLAPNGFSAATTKNILHALQQGAQTGNRFLSATHELTVQHNTLYLQPKTMPVDAHVIWEAEQAWCPLPDGQSVHRTFLHVPPYPLPNNLVTVCVDADRFQFPVRLRRWKNGDRMAPLGMGGQTRKLQDLFSDAKWSKRQKMEAWVLESQGRIVWVPYLRLSEEVKIQSNTGRCLLLSWHSNKKQEKL